jgi:hypothetical protein
VRQKLLQFCNTAPFHVAILQHSLLQFTEGCCNVVVKTERNKKFEAVRVMRPRENSRQILECILTHLVSPQLALPPSAMAGQAAWK